MTTRRLLPGAAILLVVGGGGAAGAQERTVSRPDTVLWIIPQLREPGRSLLSPPPPPVPVVRLGLALIPVTRYGPRLRIGDIGPDADPVIAPTPRDWSRDPLFRLGTLGRTIGYGRIPAPAGRGPSGRLADTPVRFRNEFADLGFAVTGSGDFGADWTQYRPCDDAVQLTCAIPRIPRLTPDIQFGARADGTITDRIVVDVDYDQARENAAANRINIRYQGSPGEVFQRLEIGDVRFDLPPSRYLLGGVPQGSFGFQAALEAGPVEVRSVWAQEAGEVTSRTFRLEGSGRTFSRSDTLVLDDADYIEGQFFFLFDPEGFFDYPHIDALALTPNAAPSSLAPGAEPIQLYRSTTGSVSLQQVEGQIQADAVAGEGADTVAESAWFQYLRPGRDYMVHPSGLWVALQAPLEPDAMLAVTYVTEAGDTVGTYNPERIYRSGGRPRLKLLRASAAQHRPGRPTWATEMHQVYRVSLFGDVDPASVELTVSLGEESLGRTFARRDNGDDVTYLRLFGLDEESPRDRLDESHIYRPALDSFEDQPPVSGTFIVFPTLEPFASPPPLRSVDIDSTEVRRLLGENRNERIYRAADPFEREYGGVFRLNLAYEVTGDSTASSFSLGAAGIREGSERVTLDDRLLVRGVDYTIVYEVGQLRLRDLEGLLATTPGRNLEVTWEQRSSFRVVPSSVFGMNARYDLGDYGELNLIGLYQTEDQQVRRPRLGLESSAVGLGGFSGNLNLDAHLLTRALNAIPGLRAGERSSVHLSGEAAVSLPNPNTQGAVYLDDYDGVNALPLLVESHEWHLGSRPAFTDGAEEVLPPEMSVDNRAAMTWQHTWIEEDVGGDSLGVFPGFNPAVDIDQQIRVTGGAVREWGLLGRFEHAGGDVEGTNEWASITTVLNRTGRDLTKSDFVEFYVRDGDFLTLVLDLGIVSEDAFFVDALGRANGVKPGTGVPWGLDILDQEADPRRGEIWGTVADERGVWAERCRAEQGRVYRLGDPNANCTRGNGIKNSEDLDEDGNLDTLERYRRFVVRLDGSSPFMVRDRDETGTSFRLYRVPIRDPTGIDLGGAITDAELRAVRHLRITVAGKRRDSFVLARMSIVGSTWVKRTESGVLSGLGGDTASVHGRVEVGPVSKVTVGDAYTSPPGVIEQLDDPTAAFGGQGIEFNERSLSVAFENILPGDRAEVYNRFPQQPRDFLSYREARLWAVAARGDFGAGVPAWFFVKIGTDDRNFYLFRTRLDPVDTPGTVREEEWLPEVVIDFEEWLQLRRNAEVQFFVNPRMPGDPPLVLWSADSTYAIVMQDRGRAPNLASVREMSLGVMNGTGAPLSGEVWVDELRLSRGTRDRGLVSAVDAEVRGGDFLHSRASFRSRSGHFRQLRATPSYHDDRTLDLQTTLQLGRFTPSEWGIEAPLSMTYEREDQSPIFLGRSDVRANQLQEARQPGFNRTRIDLSLRRRTAEGSGFWDAVLDGFDARAGVVRSSLRTITTESDSDGVDAFVGYLATPAHRDVPLFPGWVGDALRLLLPSFLEDRVAGARLRWTPYEFSFQSEMLDRDLSTVRFDHIIETDEDSLAQVTEAPRRKVSASASVVLRPFPSLTAGADFLSGRDLLTVEELSGDQGTRDLLAGERRRLGGVDLGWEVDRHVRTSLVYQPRLSDWARTRVQVNTIYFTERNSDLIETRHTPVDTALVLLRNVDGQRNLEASLSLDPVRLAAEAPEGSFVRRWSSVLNPLFLSYTNRLTSRFNREPVNPGTIYELGWGGRDDFLVIGRDSASTLGDQERFTVGGGLKFLGSGSLDIGYQRDQFETLDTRSDREYLSTVWPDVSVSVTNVALPGFLAPVLERLSASAGYRHVERALEFGAGARQNRFGEDQEVPASLTLVFPRGVSVTYDGQRDRGESLDPTGETRTERNSHALRVEAALRSPLSAFRRRGARMRLSVRLSYSDEVQCRQPRPGTPCVAFIDQLERDASVSLDSTLRDYQLEVSLRYLDRRSFVGRRAGLTRFQLDIFGRFLLTPGLLAVRG
ncbi:MAG: hypothetical protein OXQ93_07540 [Gemmatimonadota bacterium]|nr:hypothetical protein [Gemmatimonadota bacterium]